MLFQIKCLSILVTCAVVCGCAVQALGPSQEDIRQAQLKLKIIEGRVAEARVRLLNGDNSDEVLEKFLKERCSYLREEEFYNSIRLSIPCVVSTPVLSVGENEFIEKSKNFLVDNFKDPNSSIFRKIYISRRDVPVVCGEVNGKNSYGGYVGFKKFYATDTPNFFALDDGSLKFGETWERLCVPLS